MKQLLTFFVLITCLQLNAQLSGDSLTKATMASAWQYMNGDKEDAAKAFALFTQCVSRGNAEAMNALGVQYKIGLGVNADYQKSTEWFAKAAHAGYAKAWYNLGLTYKDSLNFTRAFDCFTKAAELQDPQSIYAKGYMLYKGLGCTQNYQKAVSLFAQGAVLGRSNSMYFLGLCYRNGYGIKASKDSARYWLLQATSFGYRVAQDELSSKEPEHLQEASALAAKIKAAQRIMPKNTAANQYNKATNKMSATNVAGAYTGYLLKYDWSGRHVVEVNRLTISLHYINDSIKGFWTEDDTLTIPINASLTTGALVFNKMQYRKTSHYSPLLPELYLFETAHLQRDKSKDGVYLSGNIEQFIPSRNEPARPLSLALKRTEAFTAEQISHQ